MYIEPIDNPRSEAHSVWRRWAAAAPIALIGCVAWLATTGCVVDGRCYGDGDCAGGRICLAGECVYECADDEDCGGCRRCAERRCTECCRDSDCGADELCDEEVCVPAPGCLGCGQLEHGSGACLHGICIVEACEPGHYDVNGDATDGCEYACTPTGDETCNELDDDCDGRVDEDFNLARDVLHCGGCDTSCPVPDHAEPVCAGGGCYFQCLDGFYDNDGVADNGCEATTCAPTNGGVEQCDLRDNDCNGTVDDGFDKDSVESCGPLCHVCAFDHATAGCVGGACVIERCDESYHDWDGDVSNGCEAHCVPTDPPTEVCDEVDNDCDGQVDEGLVCSCPEGMVVVEFAFCIDVWEASRPDATATATGSATGMAVSQPGVMSWRNATFDEAAAACAGAGKRLCEPAEFEQACRGPDGTEYCYGDAYEAETCNGIDAFPYPGFHPVPTGEFEQCTNEYGVFDINGNLWERMADGTVRGGAYNCSDSASLHRCGYVPSMWNATSVQSNFGFRCCL